MHRAPTFSCTTGRAEARPYIRRNIRRGFRRIVGFAMIGGRTGTRSGEKYAVARKVQDMKIVPKREKEKA
jgi:hypothetical protein